MDTNNRFTLYLWLEGLFPRTVAYYLLLKGLVDSPSQMYEGRTNHPRLEIRVLSLRPTGIESSDPHDPKPQGKTTPCLRVIDEGNRNKTTWINESSSILRLLEDLNPQEPCIASSDPLDRATMNDCLAAVYQGLHDCVYYLTNAAAVTGFWSGIKNEERSLFTASHAKQAMMKTFAKTQEWAAQGLQTSGWLTPGLETPGLVDVVLAAGVRYMELVYAFDLLEDEALEPLRRWYTRFKQHQWWDEYEERGRHPKELRYPADCREV